MKRILLMVFRNLLLVPGMWIRLCYHAAHVDKYTEAEHYELMRYIVKRANIGGNLTIKHYGAENLPKEGACMYVSNHQGMYDALAIIDASPNPFGIVFKKELENIPFLKQLIATTRSFALDRDDARQGMKVILGVTEELKKGRRYLIFPEGTRSREGNKIGPFKGGSFKAAQKAKCPIVPIALIDCYKPFDISSIKPASVQVHILKPLEYEEYKDMKTNEIADLVRARIEETVEKYIDD